MDRIDLNTPTNINGIFFGENGRLISFVICSNKMTQIICHGLSEHFVTTKGGFYAGKNSYSTYGVALGRNAQVLSDSGEAIDGIQLGTGVNNEPNTLKVYDYKLLGSDGKIPSDRLPNITIEMDIVNNSLCWRYVGSSQWIPLIDINNLRGRDGENFRIDEYGDLTESKITQISNSVTTGRYLFLVNPFGDKRSDNRIPEEIGGDMSRHIIMYDGDEQRWYDYGEFTGLQGEPGVPIQLQNNGTWIQWKYLDSPTWTNLVALSSLKGDKGDKGDPGQDGKNIELDASDPDYIRWRSVGDTSWNNLISKSSLVGPKGDRGDDGREVEFRIYQNRWLQWRYVGELTWANTFDLYDLNIRYEPKNSIELDDNKLQLVGDSSSPGNNKYYGTNNSGAKGFHSLPPSGEMNVIESVSLDGSPISPVNKNIPIVLSDKYLKLNQSTKQELSSSPIFNNLTSGRIVIVNSDKSLTDTILKKSSTITSNSTLTPTGDVAENELYVTALAENTSINAPSGTPENGNTLLIRIKDNGTSRTLTWNSIYSAFSYSSLPTSTPANKTMYLGFIYNSSSNKWELVSRINQL